MILEAYPDGMYETLIGMGYSGATVDMMYANLASMGYTGALADMLYKYNNDMGFDNITHDEFVEKIKDNSYLGRLVISLLNISVDRASAKTVMGYPADGYPLGDELVTNGDFSDGLTGWTLNAAATSAVTVIDGELSYPATHGDYAECKQLSNSVVGKTYEVTFDIKSKTDSGTAVTLQYGRANLYLGPIEAINLGIHTFTVVSTHTDGFAISVRTDGVVAIDNVSAREVIPQQLMNIVSHDTAALTGGRLMQTVDDGASLGEENITDLTAYTGTGSIVDETMVLGAGHYMFDSPYHWEGSRWIVTVEGSGSVQIRTDTVVGYQSEAALPAIYEFDGDTHLTDTRIQVFSTAGATITGIKYQEVIPQWSLTGVGTKVVTTVAEGAELGDELVVNGGFDTDSDWVKGSANITISSGAAHFSNATGSSDNIYQLNSVVGKTYQITYTISNWSGTGTARLRYPDFGTLFSGNGTYTDTVTSALGRIQFSWASGTVSFDLDNISVKEVLPTEITYPDYATALDVSLNVEDSATNLITYSEDFSDDWGSGGVTVTSDSIDSPDGTQTASFIEADATTTTHYVSAPDSAVTLGETYTATVYAKKGTSDFIQLVFPSTSFGTTVYANFDLADGAVTQEGAGAITDIISFGDGYYRISLSGVATASVSIPNLYIFNILTSTDSRYPSVDGTGLSFYLYGAQLEEGSVATSYMPTEGGTTSRAADIATVPTPSVLSAESGAIEMVVTPSDANQPDKNFLFLGYYSTNFICVRTPGSLTSVYYEVRSNGGTVVGQAFPYSYVAGQEILIKIYWGGGIMGISIDDAAFLTNVATMPLSISETIDIGHQSGLNIFEANYHSITCYKDASSAGWI